MTPDLNQLRRDLGLTDSNPPSRVVQPYATVDVEPRSAPEPTPTGIQLNDVGVWLLTIIGVVVAIWLLVDPICMLAVFLWEMICAVAAFIFNIILWTVGIMFCLGCLSKLCD